MINSNYLSASMTSQLSRNISDVRERLKTVSTEAVTGRVNDPTKHLSGQIGDAADSRVLERQHGVRAFVEIGHPPHRFEAVGPP